MSKSTECPQYTGLLWQTHFEQKQAEDPFWVPWLNDEEWEVWHPIKKAEYWVWKENQKISLEWESYSLANRMRRQKRIEEYNALKDWGSASRLRTEFSSSRKKLRDALNRRIHILLGQIEKFAFQQPEFPFV